MAKKQGVATKIYEIKSIGFDDIKSQLRSVTAETNRLRQAKQELDKALAKSTDPGQSREQLAQSKKLDQQLEQNRLKVIQLSKEHQAHMNVLKQEILQTDLLRSAQQKQGETSIKAYSELNKQYREARDNAAAMAKQFGVDSQQARDAAAAAAQYKQQLIEINTLIKNGGRPAAARPAIVSTDNLAELRAEQQRSAAGSGGTVVNDVERAQAEAANTATAYGASQREAAAATQAAEEEFDRIKTPLEEYTGTLRANILQNESYKNRISQIDTELKTLSKTTDAAGKRSRSYKDQVASLVEEKKMLKLASSEVSQTIGSQLKYVQAAEGSYDQMNAALGISRNLMRQLSDEEKASPFGKKLAADITLMDNNLKQMDATMGNHQRNVGNYGNVWTKAFGMIKQAANILPGLGIQGIFLALFVGLEKLGEWLVKIASKTADSKRQAELYAQALTALNQEAIKGSTADLSKLELLRGVINDTAKSQQARTNALREYNNMADEANKIDTKQLDNLTLINDKISAQIDLIERRGLARAAESIIAQRGEKLLLAEEKAGTRVRNTFGQTSVGGDVGTGSFNIGKKPTLRVGDTIDLWDPKTNQLKRVVVTPDILKQQEEAARIAAESRTKVNRESLIRQQVSKDPEVKAAREELDAAVKAFRDRVAGIFEPGEGEKRNLDTAVKDYLSIIEANMRRALAAEETRVAEIKKVRKLTYDEEMAYARNIEAISIKFLNQKIAYLSAQKNLDAEQKAQLAGFIKDRADAQLKAADQIKAINDREFAEQQARLKERLDDEIRKIREAEQVIVDDINSSEEAKARAKIDANKQSLALTEKFGKDIIALEQKYGAQSVKVVKDIGEQLATLRRLIKAGEKEASLAVAKDMEKAMQAEISGLKKQMAERRKLIAESQKLTVAEKESKLKELGKAEEMAVLAIEVKYLREYLLPLYQLLLEAKLISQTEYLNKVAELANKEAKLQEETLKKAESIIKKATSLSDLIRRAFSSAAGAKDGDDLDRTIGEAVAQSYDLAQSAMHSYYDAERARIQESLAANLERLDIERQQVLARAQSQQEMDSIERQYAAKKKKLEQQAHEDLKRTKRSEAKIALATELANIWASVWRLGFPMAPILGGVMTGLAVARYGQRVAEINREKFEYGGQPGDVPTEGGRFGGRPHSDGGTPFQFQGRAYEAEVGELSVIRTKNAPANRVFSLSGTHTQIASMLNELGGGRRFAAGGRMSRFEYGGNLGEGLQAPVFTPVQANTIVQGVGLTREEQLAIIQRMEGMISATNSRIDRLRVMLVTGEVTEAQSKESKQTAIGRI